MTGMPGTANVGAVFAAAQHVANSTVTTFQAVDGGGVLLTLSYAPRGVDAIVTEASTAAAH